MKTNDYINALKAKTGITSDYGVAKLLGTSRQAASDWNTGRSQLSPLNCFKVADILEIPVDRVIADIELERAEKAGKEDQANAWKTLLEKLGGVAATLLLGTVLSAPTPADARETVSGMHIVAKSDAGAVHEKARF